MCADCVYVCVYIRFIGPFAIDAQIIDFFPLCRYFLEKKWLGYIILDLEFSSL